MSKWLIRCLAMVTMLASSLHAQCLMACSVQPAAHANAVQNVRSTAHSCCPDQDEQNTGQSSEKPCQPDSAAISAAVDETTVTATVNLPVTFLAWADSQPPLLAGQTRMPLAAPPVHSSLNRLSSISILRI